MLKETLFYTHTDERYGHFVLPFMYFALMANTTYSVEVWSVDSNRHRAGVDWLNETFGERALLVETNTCKPSKSRFTFPPKTRKPYTYISDVDILILDPHVTEWHINNLDDRCFSNAIRVPLPHEKHPRLTGLMFVISDEWYSATADARKSNYLGSDEMMLAQIAFAAFPETRANLERKQWARPVHGIHMSPARDPIAAGGVDWEITSRWLHSLKRIEKDKTWSRFWELTDNKWKQQYKRIV